MKKTKSKFFALMIIAIFSISIIAIFQPTVKAVPNHDIYFTATEGGTVYWEDLTMPYNDGFANETNSPVNANTPDGDILRITTSNVYGYLFQKFIWTTTAGSGEIIGVNPLTTTAIISDFNITAVFIESPNYYRVDFLNTPDGGAQITWEYPSAGQSGFTGRGFFPYGASITITGGAESGYAFNYFEIIGSVNQGIFPQNPLTFTVLGACQIVEHTVIVPQDAYALNVVYQTLTPDAFAGGAQIWWILGGNQTQFGAGSYIVPANTIIVLQEAPASNYAFKGWYVVGENRVGTNEVFQYQISKNTTIYPVFWTNSIHLSVIGAGEGSTETSFNLVSGATYQCYVSVFENISETNNNLGFYVIETTEVSADPNIASGAEYHAISYGNFSNGYFQFAVQTQNYSTARYMGLSIVMMFNGTTVDSDLFTMGTIEDSWQWWFDRHLLQDQYFSWSSEEGLFEVSGAQITYAYKFNYLQNVEQYITNTTPTPPAFDYYGSITDYLWSATAKLIYGCISLIGFSTLFAWLLRHGAALEGVLIGLVCALIVNILLLSWSTWALFVVVCLIVLIIVTRLKGKG